MLEKEIDKKIEEAVEKEYSIAKKEFSYPKWVVDEQAFDSFLFLSNSWKNNSYRFYKCEFKKDLVIDLAQVPSVVEEICAKNKIPEKEKEIILKLNSELYLLVKKSIIQKKKAFGEESVVLRDGIFVADNLAAVTPMIIELAGRYYSPEEIHQTLCQDMEITNVALYNVKQVVKDNIAKIKELREKFKESYSDVRLSFKRSRLDELNYIYNRRKQIYNDSNAREDEKQLIQILDTIKKEVQGDLTINMNIQVEDQANLIVKNEILKELNISMLILSRIAGRINKNPLLLLSRLANSKYSQFSGYSERGLSPTNMQDEIFYPSGIIYNWQNIEDANAEILKEEEEKSQLPELKNSDKILSLKNKLLEKLNLSKEPLEKSKEEIRGDLIK